MAPLTGIPIRLIAAGTTHCMALTGTLHHHNCLTSLSCQTLTFTSCSVSGSLYCWGGYFFHLHDSAEQPTSHPLNPSLTFLKQCLRSTGPGRQVRPASAVAARLPAPPTYRTRVMRRLPHRCDFRCVHARACCGACAFARIGGSANVTRHAIPESGTLYTWGQGSYGQLGHGVGQMELQPRAVFELLGTKVSVDRLRCAVCVTNNSFSILL